jgi:hypothetical protein
MKKTGPDRGFTMAEMLIALTGSTIIIGAMMLSSVSLQKAFRASEQFAAGQADQRRLIDYLARDLRRAVGIATSTQVNGSAATKVRGESVVVEKETALVLTLPGYYQSNAPDDAKFDAVLPVMVTERRADYGTAAGQAPGVPVLFRKVFVAKEGCVCFVRQEAEAQEIIVRRAEELQTRITLQPDGTACVVEVWFQAAYGSARPVVAAHDVVMLRNNRID